jgi:hypothetical protein
MMFSVPLFTFTCLEIWKQLVAHGIFSSTDAALVMTILKVLEDILDYDNNMILIPNKIQHSSSMK